MTTRQNVSSDKTILSWIEKERKKERKKEGMCRRYRHRHRTYRGAGDGVVGELVAVRTLVHRPRLRLSLRNIPRHLLLLSLQHGRLGCRLRLLLLGFELLHVSFRLRQLGRGLSAHQPALLLLLLNFPRDGVARHDRHACWTQNRQVGWIHCSVYFSVKRDHEHVSKRCWGQIDGNSSLSKQKVRFLSVPRSFISSRRSSFE
eukprot:COSAG06_NODE_52_length_28059_cov_48.831378_19_plen_202_part_00